MKHIFDKSELFDLTSEERYFIENFLNINLFYTFRRENIISAFPSFCGHDVHSLGFVRSSNSNDSFNLSIDSLSSPIVCFKEKIIKLYFIFRYRLENQ